jgi:YVTN family beta-propeller protein
MGDALVNSTIYQGVVINNTGQGYLFLGSIYNSSGSADFDILPYEQNQVIAPGGTAAVTVKLTPSSTGSRSAAFTVTSNTPNTPSANFTVSGNGVTQIAGGIDFVWANKFTIPGQASVSSLSGVTINNVIYVIGGASGGDYKYDPTTNSWNDIAPRPFGQFGGGDAVNGKVYTVAYDGSTASTRAGFYDPATNNWGVGAAMPALRLDIAVAAANGKVYAFGGRNGVGGDALVTSDVYEYNPATNTWAVKASMPTARMGAVAVTLNGLIYVMGGMSGSQKLQTVEVYNPANNTWATRERMPSPRAWASSFIINGKIYVAGGIGNSLGQGGSDSYDLVEEFDPSKADSTIPGVLNAWAVRNHLINGRISCAAGAVNNKGYVLGGMNASGAGVYSIEEGVLAASPKINLPVTTASFGDVSSGNIGEKGVEVQNLGNALLTVSASRVSGSSDFSLFRSVGSLDQGKSFTFKIRFTPSSTGSKTATFRFTSNDPGKPTVDVTVTGNGVAAPPQAGAWQVINSISLSDNNGQPTRMAISNGKAYITRANNGSGGALTVLDLATNAVTGNISMSAFPSGQPHYVTVSGNRAYLALGNLSPSGQLAVINTDNNTVLNFIPVGVEPFGVGFVGSKGYVSNSVYWSNGDPATVTVVDASSNTVTKTITVGRGPTAVAADADTGKVYVTNPCNGAPNCSDQDTPNPLKSLSVIDSASDTVVTTIPLPYNPGAVALAGNRAYVLTGATVEVIDLSSTSVAASMPVPDSSYDIAATSEYVLILNSSKVTVISAATNSIVGYLDIASAGSISIDPATNLAYVTRPSDKAISVLRLIAPAFSVSTNTQSLAATAGGNTAFTTTVSSIDGFSGSVSLSCEGLPTGATCQFAQNPVSVPANGSVSTNLTVNVQAGTVSGPYNLRVVGNGSVPTSPAAENTDGTTAAAAGATAVTDFQNLSLTVPSCDYALSSQSAPVGSGAGTGSVDLAGTTGCSWAATSDSPWLVITSGTGGSGGGTVRFSVSANTGPARTGTLTIAGQTFTVTQAAAVYRIGGHVADSSGVSLTGVTITLGGSTAATTTTDPQGNYSFPNLAAGGSYTLTPSLTNYTFAPPPLTFNNLGADQSGDFVGTLNNYTLSGRTLLGGAGLPGVTVTLLGSRTGSAVTDSGGHYSFTVPAGGSYVVTPMRQNYTFSPPSATYTNLGSSQSFDFAATLNSYAISGRVTDANNAGLSGVTVSLSGSATDSTTTDASGNYSFPSVAAGGSYTVTPSKPFYTFSPAGRSLANISGDQAGVNFTGALNQYTVSGRVTLSGAGDPLAGVTVTMSAGSAGSATSDAQGNYSFANVPGGASVTLTPAKANYTFAPAQQSITVDGDRPGVNFAATAAAATVQFGQAEYQFSEGVGRAGLTITRSGNTSTGVSVTFQTVDDPAAVRCDNTVNNHGAAYARCDYATTVDTITFATGETTKTVTVPIIDDSFVEGAETFQVRLLDPQGAALGTPSTATVTILDNDSPGQANPILSNDFFLRMQYLDFLSRDPEPDGFNAWLSTINNCPAGDQTCDRVAVSANFFRSTEFQLKGLFVFKFYKVAFGRMPLYSEIIPDMSSVTGSSTAELIAKKAAFTSAFTQRQEFRGLYDQMTSQQFVDALMGRYGLQSIATINPLSPDDSQAQRVTLTRSVLVNQLTAGTLTRGQVVRAMADSNEVSSAEFNPAFVAMQYFGYLRRDPETGGYNDWLRTINANPSDIHSMVNGFVNSTEYRLRFGQP